MECATCEKSMRGGSPIVVFTASFFGADGRWTEHLTVDSTCSMNCMAELCGWEEGQDESSPADQGATCERCAEVVDMGYTLMLGWAKKASVKKGWHKAITTKQFCSHGCIAAELDDKGSPLNMDIPKRQPSSGSSKSSSKTKKKTTRRKTK